MSIKPVVEKSKIREAYAIFSRSVTEGSQAYESVVAFPGGNETATVFWHADRKFWVLLQPERLGNQFWCAFGTDDPTTSETLAITWEINPPHLGYNRQCAGMFICDSTDSVYLAHNGKINGGRAGVGRTTFLASRSTDDVVPVEFPDRKEYEYIAIGRIDDSDFLADVARFVHSVADFKQAAVLSKAAAQSKATAQSKVAR